MTAKRLAVTENWRTGSGGGLVVTKQMHDILDQPGFISTRMGGERLRGMFQDQSNELDLEKLSLFAQVCMCGNLERVKAMIQSGDAPDLVGTETSFKLGFASLTVLGAQRIRSTVALEHPETLRFLLERGAPPDMLDIAGLTSLHHACTPPQSQPVLARILLKAGASPNIQNRYGEVVIFFPFQGGNVPLIEMLMDYGADLDIRDANGDSPRSLCHVYGPEVVAAVKRCERKRTGEQAPLEDKKCENCQKKSDLKQCARCHTTRYCSSECQREPGMSLASISNILTSFLLSGAHWKTHKPQCHPFSTSNTVTVKPRYENHFTTLSFSDLTREKFGLANDPNAGRRKRPTQQTTTPNTASHEPNKSMIIKVQLPLMLGAPVSPSNGSGDMLVYNKKKDFTCSIQKADNPHYDEIARVIRAKGVNGLKAYFAAELKNKYELVIKISEVLAEQPF
ncbi:ankyrin [Leucogyrophana mollusca]|uniref:Ankyrin n=1 Tax=Leucogyrophana mollusca TaxID=85980 RepID=A0ACB8B5S0_9AGAM|nr:ankyrin [Leucogyrophana mollusca]